MISVKPGSSFPPGHKIEVFVQMSDILDTLRQEGVDPALLTAVQEYRAAHPLSEVLRPRIPAPAFTYYGKEVWEQALAVLHAVLDFRRAIDVPGYDRIPLAEETRFIATMNYGYAGTRELNEALTSRFAVVQMPTITQDNLEKLLRAQFPDLSAKYVHQFALLFLDLQKKCDSAEISTKALDLRGMLDALRLIRRGIPAGAALDMGITNKAFDSYEQSLIRDVIAARIPAKLDAAKLFG